MAKNVSTDDLVQTLLTSVATSSSSATSRANASTTSRANVTTSSPATSTSLSDDDASSRDDGTATSWPTPSPTPVSPVPSDHDQAGRSTDARRTGAPKDSGTSTGLKVGLALAIVALVLALVLLVLRFKRRRVPSKRESASSSPILGDQGLPVPSDRGFKKERALGMPEMSIELPPGELGLSKMSYASSARSSLTSNHRSSDSSVFNTKGGVSPAFSNTQKNASYTYQYRTSDEHASKMAASTTFHLTGRIGNGQSSSRAHLSGSRALGNRKLSTPDEYAELVTATNAHETMSIEHHHAPSPDAMLADFTQSSVSHHEELEMSMGPDAEPTPSVVPPLPTTRTTDSVSDARTSEKSMGPDADNQSFLAPLPVRPAATTRTSTNSMLARASEESMGPDSPTTSRGGHQRTGLVYTIPDPSRKLSVVPMSGVDEDEAATNVLTASFLSESSISSFSSVSTCDSEITVASGSTVGSSSSSRTNYGDAGPDSFLDRASKDASYVQQARSGSFIALNLDAKDGNNEIAI